EPFAAESHERSAPEGLIPRSAASTADGSVVGGFSRSDDSLGEHRLGDADETGDIGSGDVVSGRPEFLGSGSAAVVDIAHDLGQTCLGEVEVPGVAAGVL